MAGFLAAGCGGATWPNRAVGVSTAGLVNHSAGVGTVDILPLDLHVWAERGYNGDLDALAMTSDDAIMDAAVDTLIKRHYQVGAMIDRDGKADGAAALTREDLAATMSALSHYGGTVAAHPGQLPIPYLPARLGTTTGSDATLYVGGWAYVANEHESTASQVGKGILIAIAVIAVVAIVIAIADSKDHHHHGSSSSSHPHVASGGDGGTFVYHGGFHHAFHPVAGMVDAFGRAAVDIALSIPPDWNDDPSLPHDGGDSQMYLEMTLVDNHTGLALWHAHQVVPAQLGSAGDSKRVTNLLLALLPPNGATVAAQ